MNNMLQIIGGIIMTGLITASILLLFWGAIYILGAQIRDYYFLKTRSAKIKNILTA
jgi:hypothetical protein